MPPRRILALGHTGIGKTQAVRNLANHYLSSEHGLATGLDHVDHRNHLRVACLEDHLAGIHAFLDQTNERDARTQWHNALVAATTELSGGPVQAHLVLSMHGSYYRKARAFSRSNLQQIRERFNPTEVVVFIDDIYDAAGTIMRRDPQDTLRLREIATWRSIEGMIADFIAEPLAIPSYVLAVKHPVRVASQLLFGAGLKVYSAFPITRTRGSQEARNEIEQFKARLRDEGIIVFDPSTIDELLLSNALDATDPGDEFVRVDLEKRWGVPEEALLTDGRPNPWDGQECLFARGEIEEATKDITTQVESRDFRLIQDADCIVAYRPNWGGRQSRGVTAELHLARGIARRIFIYNPKEDDTQESPFAGFGNVYQEVDELMEALKGLPQASEHA